jgi:DNA-binding MarR family transcriptional regulator
MEQSEHKDSEALTLLEVVLQLHGGFRKSLESIRVTPLQAGVLLFLRRHAEANMTNTATALRVTPPTLSDVAKDLVRKQWITKRRSDTDTRVVHLRLSRRGHALTLHIQQRVRQMESTLTDEDRQTSIGIRLNGRRE